MTNRHHSAITTPLVDTAFSGGLSILIFVPLIVITIQQRYRGELLPNADDTNSIFLFHALINWPHFMASYGVLYGSSVESRKHPWASIYIPVLLVCWALVGLVYQPAAFTLFVTSTFYLAWHYTGQAWGMIATFAYIGGHRLDRTDRILIRLGCRVLLAWHLVWQLAPLVRDMNLMQPLWYLWIYNLVSAAAVLSFVLGIAGFVRYRLRTRKWLPIRAFVPWLAIFVWYTLVHFNPGYFAMLQIAHALQYIAFPMRVELNRHTTKASSIWRMPRLAAYYLMLFVFGLLVFKAPTFFSADILDPKFKLANLIVMIVNVHHYFVDGCIWKISNPDVRKQLFAHLND